MICAGIDAGSRTLKVVLLDSDTHTLVASGVVDQGIQQDALATRLLDRLLERNNLQRADVRSVVATGYGRKLIRAADTTVTEITCQSRGVCRLVPEARTIIDIGGQDSKLLRLDANGILQDFVMNDRCAAGTGRFLEVVATRLGVELDTLGTLAAESRQPAIISSMCVVFAETEIIGLLASGTERKDIARGVQTAMATRIAAMAAGRVTAPIVLTGGVALIPGFDAAFELVLCHPITIAPDPQLTAALGAALLAAER